MKTKIHAAAASVGARHMGIRRNPPRNLAATQILEI